MRILPIALLVSVALSATARGSDDTLVYFRSGLGF